MSHIAFDGREAGQSLLLRSASQIDLDGNSITASDDALQPAQAVEQGLHLLPDHPQVVGWNVSDGDPCRSLEGGSGGYRSRRQPRNRAGRRRNDQASRRPTKQFESLTATYVLARRVGRSRRTLGGFHIAHSSEAPGAISLRC